MLQAIATENKLSETAFVVPTGLKGNYQLRWFTPATEVDLCGHATLATGALVLDRLAPSRGKGPQNLAITADGAWLLCANMPGNNIAVFQIDTTTGQLKLAGQPVSQTSPSCIMLLP